MNAPLDLRMDKATFLRWVQTQEGRYELVGGQVVMQDTGTEYHSDVALAFYDLLRPRLPRTQWAISTGQLAVEIGEEVRVADVMVKPSGTDRRKTASDCAVMLVEVVSPSSEALDFGNKRALYQSLPSLEVYIVASQDEPRIWVWQRSRDALRAFPNDAREIAERPARIELAHFGIDFTLGELYANVFPD